MGSEQAPPFPPTLIDARGGSTSKRTNGFAAALSMRGQLLGAAGTIAPAHAIRCVSNAIRSLPRASHR